MLNWTEMESVPGIPDRTGQFGPVFKTLVIVIISESLNLLIVKYMLESTWFYICHVRIE